MQKTLKFRSAALVRECKMIIHVEGVGATGCNVVQAASKLSQNKARNFEWKKDMVAVVCRNIQLFNLGRSV